MSDLNLNGFRIQVQADSGVVVKWEKQLPGLKHGVLPEKNQFEIELENEGYSELTHACLLNIDKDRLTKPLRVTMNFVTVSAEIEDTDSEDVFILMRQDINGKVISMQSVRKSNLTPEHLEPEKLKNSAMINIFSPGESIVRIFKKAVEKVKGAIKAISRWEDSLKQLLYNATDAIFFKPENGFGLKYLNAQGKTQPLSNPQLDKMKTGRNILFIHGIFSNVHDAFHGLANPNTNSTLQYLHDQYQGRVYGFDHATFSKDCLENSLRLLKELPEDTEFDLICHSRGGQVTRCLLEHPEARSVADRKNIQFSNILFVAGACEGSQLASDKFLQEFLFVLTAIGVIPSLNTLIKILEALAQFAHNAPGVTCLDPASSLNAILNSNVTSNTAKAVSFCRANFDPESTALDLLDDIVFDLGAFNKKGNDCVVPFNTANIAEKYKNQETPKVKDGKDFGTTNTPQEVVYHLNFFEQPEVRERIQALFT